MSHELDRIADLSLSLTPLRDRASQMADELIRTSTFARYQQELAPQTRRRQRADLSLFVIFLTELEHPATQGQTSGGLSGVLLAAHLSLFWLMIAALMDTPQSWEGITYGLVELFKQWQLARGYAIGSVNVRLSTVRKYIKLACDAGIFSKEEYGVIRELAKVIPHKQGMHIDQERPVTRIGEKKAEPTTFTSEQVERLITAQPDTPRGARDVFLLVLLFHYILRCGEIADLTLSNYNRATAKLTFYHKKTDNFTTLQLEPEDRARAERYFAVCNPLDQERNPTRCLVMGSDNKGHVFGTMGEHSISKRVNVLCKRILGIPYASGHDARHHGSTEYALGGTDASTLQHIGGWRNVIRPLAYVNAAKVANQNARRGTVE